MFHYLTFVVLFLFLSLQISASPAISLVDLERRTDPVFPSSPASCGICEQSYPSISSCAQAAPVLANLSMIIFNPGSFIDVIKCACGDTFQAVFPQCVDCFIQTGQQDVLNVSDLPGLVNNTRQICGLESTLLGNVSGVNSAPSPSPTSGNVLRAQGHITALAVIILIMGIATIF
ncbi:hypothetical protein BDN70DRAFT_850198 [Pholiota conissans]|uniref:Uncharacterized protein n=1 Tax=Pholiota conissans TaxID=109636 RepID=A0A9P6D602_9AGAR|nr:hypothetical protein BDN70DRAFT_850198 [Pholiota conissans]